MLQQQPEIWLRGPVQQVPALLQPVAHALLQARQEISDMLAAFPAQLLWVKPAGLASVAFHLQHIAGVLDRMYTYAAAQPLTQQQLQYLAAEGVEDEKTGVAELVTALIIRIENFVEHLKQVPEPILTHSRAVGRKQLPSTVAGLLFHAAEHTMRHTGQLLVTVQVLKAGLAH